MGCSAALFSSAKYMQGSLEQLQLESRKLSVPEKYPSASTAHASNFYVAATCYMDCYFAHIGYRSVVGSEGWKHGVPNSNTALEYKSSAQVQVNSASSTSRSFAISKQSKNALLQRRLKGDIKLRPGPFGPEKRRTELFG